jgi:type III pantothenate kinase
MPDPWLALIIGNTRLHWGLFEQDKLKAVWHTPHLTDCMAQPLKSHGFVADAWHSIFPRGNDADINADIDLLPQADTLPEQAIALSALWVASVVPQQAALWESANFVVRSHIPLLNLYPALGLDRAINLLGAGSTLGWPVLVVDSGTALTFTAGVQQLEGNALYGGAILPGLGLQRQALAQQTAALAKAAEGFEGLWGSRHSYLPERMPERWAMDSVGAIASGSLYGTTAIMADYMSDWWQRFPAGKVVLTGGDGPMLHRLLQQRTPAMAARVQLDSHLMFWGMQAYCKGLR